MTDTVVAQLAALKTAPIAALREKWRDLFESEPPPYNRLFLQRRLSSRIQEIADKELPAQAQKRHVVYTTNNMPTFYDFVVERYMPDALATKRSACWEQIIFRNHLFPAFGHLRLDEITRSAISLMIQEKVMAGYKPGTVNRILANLKKVLAKAVEWEVGGLEKNVAKQVKALRDPPHLDRFLTQAEAGELIRAVHKSQSPMLRFIIPFLLFTGARKREALDARWNHVDMDARLWTIPLSKSGKPRYVPLSEQAIVVLKRARAAAEVMINVPCPWVFPNPLTCKPYTSIFEPWDICRRSVGLAELRIHDLRHSFASALVNRGMTLFDVKEALGHSNIATTQRYAHLSQERLRKAVQQAGDHYGTVPPRRGSGLPVSASDLANCEIQPSQITSVLPTSEL